jgi:DNA-binding transcriptional ArsR family regulator
MPMVLLEPVFRALGDPTRRWIVEQLLDAEASVLWLLEPHPMSLTAFMRHLRVLEQCGLIRTHKVGRTRQCSIAGDAAPLRAAEAWMRRALWARYRNRLGALPEDWGFRGGAPPSGR